MNRRHKAEVMIAGEQLRLRLHFVKLIKDRRVHLRTYPNCFVSEELCDWLRAHREVPDRQTAISVMQKLLDHDIIHHVCDKWSMFKDGKLLYRFRKDDGTFPFSIEEKVFTRGQNLYQHLLSSRQHLLQVREERGVVYKQCFAGFQLIDWLLQNGEAESRSEGVELCRTLLEHGIIQHVCQNHQFVDSALLYQFGVNFRRRRRLAELVEAVHAGKVVSCVEDQQADSPFVLRRTPPPDGNANFLSGVCSDDVQVSVSEHQTQTSSFTASLSTVVRSNPKSVLKRMVTCEELMSAGAPYVKKVLTVLGDALGWGFVVRGKSPCYIQAVDPESPAAQAGVKVCQFVCQVNSVSVLHMDYSSLTKLVMTGPRVVTLEVMEPLD